MVSHGNCLVFCSTCHRNDSPVGANDSKHICPLTIPILSVILDIEWLSDQWTHPLVNCETDNLKVFQCDTYRGNPNDCLLSACCLPRTLGECALRRMSFLLTAMLWLWGSPGTSFPCFHLTDPTSGQEHWHGTEGTVQETNLVQCI